MMSCAMFYYSFIFHSFKIDIFFVVSPLFEDIVTKSKAIEGNRTERVFQVKISFLILQVKL